MSSDRYARISAAIEYDGQPLLLWIQSGVRLMFRFDLMPAQHFLPNKGFEVEEIIRPGESGKALIDIISDENTWPLLALGSRFTLHSGPSNLVAHGIVTDVSFDPDRPLADAGSQ